MTERERRHRQGEGQRERGGGERGKDREGEGQREGGLRGRKTERQREIEREREIPHSTSSSNYTTFRINPNGENTRATRHVYFVDKILRILSILHKVKHKTHQIFSPSDAGLVQIALELLCSICSFSGFEKRVESLHFA